MASNRPEGDNSLLVEKQPTIVSLTGALPLAAAHADDQNEHQKNSWGKLSQGELRTLLRCFNLPTEGKKNDLVRRLAQRTQTATSQVPESLEASRATTRRPTSSAPSQASTGVAAAASSEDRRAWLDQRPELVVFDLETTIPRFKGDAYALLEFAAIIVDGKTLVEDRSRAYQTLIRPADLGSISKRSVACNHITQNMVQKAPCFELVADRVFRCLNGRTWVGHNILRFDVPRLREAFAALGRPMPQAAAGWPAQPRLATVAGGGGGSSGGGQGSMIDTLPLLKSRFESWRAGGHSMEALGRYFGQGNEKHRALDDARMTLSVLRSAAAVLFLEQHALAFAPPPKQRPNPVLATAEATVPAVAATATTTASAAEALVPAAESRDRLSQPPRLWHTEGTARSVASSFVLTSAEAPRGVESADHGNDDDGTDDDVVVVTGPFRHLTAPEPEKRAEPPSSLLSLSRLSLTQSERGEQTHAKAALQQAKQQQREREQQQQYEQGHRHSHRPQQQLSNQPPPLWGENISSSNNADNKSDSILGVGDEGGGGQRSCSGQQRKSETPAPAPGVYHAQEEEEEEEEAGAMFSDD